MGSDARRPIWLDTDPGFDDWWAWSLLQTHPAFELLGVSIVSGNAPLTRTLDNACRIRDWHGWPTPLWAGADRPLVQSVVTAQDVLGDQGLASVGATLPPATHGPRAGDAVDALIAAARARPGELTLVAIGPLTNVALAMARAPELPSLLRQIVVMGGSVDRGNTTAVAEFNIHADPEAAAQVLGAARDLAQQPLHLFGLNVCRQVLVGPEHVHGLRALGTERAHTFADHLQAYVAIAHRRGGTHMAVYDPTPVAWLLDPGAFDFEPAQVAVELQGTLTRGMTVCEFRVPARAAPNTQVAMRADGPRVMRTLMEGLHACLR